jgi:hypothetical protein
VRLLKAEAEDVSQRHTQIQKQGLDGYVTRVIYGMPHPSVLKTVKAGVLYVIK